MGSKLEKNLKIIFLHGNGNSSPQDNWFPYAKAEFEKMGLTVVAEQLPDADLARSSFWLPFLKDILKADENSVLIGHSSGAVASMRFAEQHKVLGSVLIGAMHTDLGIEKERLSGYYEKPWKWDQIKNNQQWILQFASTDDPWIPIEEPRHIHTHLQTEYFEFNDQGHFGGDYHKQAFPELIDAVKKKIVLY
jgi:uncharacterized protein